MKIKLIAAGIILVLSIILYISKIIPTEDTIVLSDIPSDKTTDVSVLVEETIIKQIIVDISGEVVTPKVIKLAEGSRVYQAIELAGGLKITADIQQINQAAIINDGEKIFIPKIGSNPESNTYISTNNFNSNKSKLININTASVGQLDEITGVGPATAESIIAYRETIGKFLKIEDIKNVVGIGDKTYEKLKSQICIN